MRRILLLVFALFLSLASLFLVSCDKRKAISIIPNYLGEDVTDTKHEFKKEDFRVIIAYSDGTDEERDDYTFTVNGIEDGYYIIEFAFEELTNICPVKCTPALYPSEKN